ncbi:MAG: hypothetical protein H0X50_07125 [Nitrosopumilus sp.]|nr:hypothetical protein [Nitrosopumilus sp.]
MIFNIIKKKKNSSNKDVEEILGSEYIDATRYSTKSQLRDTKKNDFICKYCKRRLTNSSELHSHINSKHSHKKTG